MPVPETPPSSNSNQSKTIYPPLLEEFAKLCDEVHNQNTNATREQIISYAKRHKLDSKIVDIPYAIPVNIAYLSTLIAEMHRISILGALIKNNPVKQCGELPILFTNLIKLTGALPLIAAIKLDAENKNIKNFILGHFVQHIFRGAGKDQDNENTNTVDERFITLSYLILEVKDNYTLYQYLSPLLDLLFDIIRRYQELPRPHKLEKQAIQSIIRLLEKLKDKNTKSKLIMTLKKDAKLFSQERKCPSQENLTALFSVFNKETEPDFKALLLNLLFIYISKVNNLHLMGNCIQELKWALTKRSNLSDHNSTESRKDSSEDEITCQLIDLKKACEQVFIILSKKENFMLTVRGIQKCQTLSKKYETDANNA